MAAAANSMSSYPTIDTSPGIEYPSGLSCISIPTAMRSLPQITALGMPLVMQFPGGELAGRTCVLGGVTISIEHFDAQIGGGAADSFGSLDHLWHVGRADPGNAPMSQVRGDGCTAIHASVHVIGGRRAMVEQAALQVHEYHRHMPGSFGPGS